MTATGNQMQENFMYCAHVNDCNREPNARELYIGCPCYIQNSALPHTACETIPCWQQEQFAGKALGLLSTWSHLFCRLVLGELLLHFIFKVLYSAILSSWEDSQCCCTSDCSLSWCVFECPPQCYTYSTIWLLHGWCQMKPLPSWPMFWVHHITMHQFTVSLHAKPHT